MLFKNPAGQLDAWGKGAHHDHTTAQYVNFVPSRPIRCNSVATFDVDGIYRKSRDCRPRYIAYRLHRHVSAGACEPDAQPIGGCLSAMGGLLGTGLRSFEERRASFNWVAFSFLQCSVKRKNFQNLDHFVEHLTFRHLKSLPSCFSCPPRILTNEGPGVDAVLPSTSLGACYTIMRLLNPANARPCGMHTFGMGTF